MEFVAGSVLWLLCSQQAETVTAILALGTGCPLQVGRLCRHRGAGGLVSMVCAPNSGKSLGASDHSFDLATSLRGSDKGQAGRVTSRTPSIVGSLEIRS